MRINSEDYYVLNGVSQKDTLKSYPVVSMLPPYKLKEINFTNKVNDEVKNNYLSELPERNSTLLTS